MDKATATEFVERIELRRREAQMMESAIWRQMRERDDYEMNEDRTIADILEARAKARAITEQADADLGSFDWVENEDGDFVPREGLPA